MNQTKRYLKFLLFITIITSIITLLNKYIPAKGNEEKIKVDLLLSNQNEIKSVTLGRSHAASLDYSYWDAKGVNFALGGRDLAGINYQITYFLNNFPNIEEILISISYSTMYFDDESLAHGNLNDARKSLYYSIPSYNIIDSHDINNYVFGKFFPFIQADHGYDLLKRLFSKHHPDNTWIGDFHTDSLQISLSAKTQADLHSRDRKIAESYNPMVVTKNKDYLIDIINKVKSKGINCIFFTPPYYKDYTKYFPAKDIKEMKLIMYELVHKYDICYLDFSEDSIICNNYKYYYNADHLNSEGKRLFTQALLSKLERLNKE